MAMLHSCSKLVMLLSQSCDLIGTWKILIAGPRILPKFIRPFSSLQVGPGDETKTEKAPKSNFCGVCYHSNPVQVWGDGKQ